MEEKQDDEKVISLRNGFNETKGPQKNSNGKIKNP
jgi:hypothetical protein